MDVKGRSVSDNVPRFAVVKFEISNSILLKAVKVLIKSDLEAELYTYEFAPCVLAVTPLDTWKSDVMNRGILYPSLSTSVH